MSSTERSFGILVGRILEECQMAIWQVMYTRDGETQELIFEGGHEEPELETIYETLVDNCQIPNNGYKGLGDILKRHNIEVTSVREHFYE